MPGRVDLRGSREGMWGVPQPVGGVPTGDRWGWWVHEGGPPKIPYGRSADLAVFSKFGCTGVKKSIFSKLPETGGELKETSGDLN